MVIYEIWIHDFERDVDNYPVDVRSGEYFLMKEKAYEHVNNRHFLYVEEIEVIE